MDYILRALKKIRLKFFLISIKRNKNVFLGRGVIFCNVPMISINDKSKLYLGDKVTINSENNGYHLNMFGKCKILMDKPGAVIEIGENTRIHGSCIHAYREVRIGRNCLVAANCQIMDGNGHDLSFPDVENRVHTVGPVKPVIIEDCVWLGMNVVVLPGVRIGRGSVISANSVVHKDIPPMVIAGGNPIVVIKDMRGSFERPDPKSLSEKEGTVR